MTVKFGQLNVHHGVQDKGLNKIGLTPSRLLVDRGVLLTSCQLPWTTTTAS